MFFPEDEKEGKESALKKLKEVMLDKIGERFGGIKKPVEASMTIEKAPADEMEEKLEDALEDRGHGDDADSENGGDDKEDLEQLLEAGRHHNKYCMGGKV